MQSKVSIVGSPCGRTRWTVCCLSCYALRRLNCTLYVHFRLVDWSSCTQDSKNQSWISHLCFNLYVCVLQTQYIKYNKWSRPLYYIVAEIPRRWEEMAEIKMQVECFVYKYRVSDLDGGKYSEELYGWKVWAFGNVRHQK